MKRLKNNKAFTLVELVIVIAVIAILAAVLLPTFAGMMNNARESARTQQVTTARNEMLSLSKEAITILDLEGYIFVIDNKVYILSNQGEVLKEENLTSQEVELDYMKSTMQPTNKNVTVYLPKENIDEPIEIPLTFTLDEENKTATVKSFLNTIPSTYTIPSYVGKYDSTEDKYYITGENNYKVVGIEPLAFEECELIENIIIPDTVTDIGIGAFCWCTELTTIKLPSSLESIEYGVFYECNSLTSITIPNTVTTIGDEAFITCTSLGNIILPNNLTSIGAEAFAHCESLTSIEFPNTLTSIGEGAFASCKALESIEIPSGVTVISDSAFYNCKLLTSVTLPNTLTSIEKDAFLSCNSLTTITIPKSVTNIGYRAFGKCDLLTEIIFEHGSSDTLTIENAAFKCDTVVEITIKCLLNGENLPLNTTINTHDWLMQEYKIVTFVAK